MYCILSYIHTVYKISNYPKKRLVQMANGDATSGLKNIFEWILSISIHVFFQAQEDLSRQLTNMKQLLFGNESDQQSDIVLAQLSQEMYNTGLILALLRNLHRIDFEGKKDAVQIFNSILRRQIGTRTPTVEYICTKPDIIFTLCRG